MHQVALALQYFPPNAGRDPVTVCLTTRPDLLDAFRRVVLHEGDERLAQAGSDPVLELLERVEIDRLRALFDLLVPQEAFAE